MKAVLLSLFIGSFFILSFGEEAAIDTSLKSMSFEELLDMEVITVSKYQEKISKSGGIVSILTREEINNIGALNLHELLDRLPSTYAVGSYIFPQNTVSIRGDLPTHLSAHYLILINGRPFRESNHMGMNATTMTAFPVNAIDRIEFVRGPGSVLYGSNAYSGVINIITQQDDDISASANITTGSFNAFALNGQINISKGDFKSQLIVHSFDEDGWEFEGFISARDSALKKVDFSENNNSFVYQAKYKNLNFTSFCGQNKQMTLSNSYLVPILFNSRRFFTNLTYDKSLSDIVEIQANVTHNSNRNQFQNDTTAIFPMHSDNVLGELTTYLNPRENIHIVGGGSINYMQGERFNYLKPVGQQVLLPKYQRTWYSFYAQADYDFKNVIKLIAGVQANKNHNHKMDFVPRFGLVCTPVNNIGFKLNYGSAFRSPSGSELGLDLSPIVKGNADLFPEKVNTFDAQLFLDQDRFDFSINYFNSIQTNLIGRVSNPDPNYFNLTDNIDTLHNYGVEMASELKLNDKLFLTSSFLYQENYTGDNNNKNYNSSLMPNTHFKIGGYYKSKYYVLGAFNHYVGQSLGSYDYAFNGTPSSYNYLTAKLSLKLNEILDYANNASIYIYGINLLNQKVHYSDVFSKSIDSIPGRSGRAIYIGASFSL